MCRRSVLLASLVVTGGAALALGTTAWAGSRPPVLSVLTATDSQEIALGAALARQFDSTRGIDRRARADPAMTRSRRTGVYA